MSHGHRSGRRGWKELCAVFVVFAFGLFLVAGAATVAPVQAQEPEGEPIRIGSTLALTGFLAPTAAVHEVAGEQFVEMINEQGGLLGRPVEWVLLDDQSDPGRTGDLYERLITEEDVDLLIGPYGTANIASAMSVAERHEMVFPHHTGSLTHEYDYKWHFPLWQTGLDTHKSTPRKMFEAYEDAGADIETVAFVVSRFPGTQFVYRGPEGESGGIAVAEEEFGYEVVLDLNFDIGTSDFSPIARRIEREDPDLIVQGALGADGPNLQASLARLRYFPRGHAYQWPAPGPMLETGLIGEGATRWGMFVDNEHFRQNHGAVEFIERYRSAAIEAGIPYPEPETQAAVSWASWQLLTQAVEATGSLEQEELANWLLEAEEVPTVIGDLWFNPEKQNYSVNRETIEQVQDGEWKAVYPPERTETGENELIYPAPGAQ